MKYYFICILLFFSSVFYAQEEHVVFNVSKTEDIEVFVRKLDTKVDLDKSQKDEITDILNNGKAQIERLEKSKFSAAEKDEKINQIIQNENKGIEKVLNERQVENFKEIAKKRKKDFENNINKAKRKARKKSSKLKNNLRKQQKKIEKSLK